MSKEGTELTTEESVRLASVAMRRQGIAAAYTIAEAALTAGKDHPFLLKVRGLGLQESGQYREALQAFHHANEMAPGDPMTLNCIAGALGAMNEPAAALQVLEDSLALAEKIATTHYLRGWCEENLHRWQQAREAYKRCLQLAPRHLQALAGLASVSAELGEYDAARSLAQRVLFRLPSEPIATLAISIADIAQGNPRSAEQRLRELLGSDSLKDRPKALAWGLLGDALDAQGHTTDAFAAYEQDNKIRGTILASLGKGSGSISENLKKFQETLDATSELWAQTYPGGNAGQRHVFIAGFPRSGTTLLDQILACHPDTVVLEERDLLDQPSNYEAIANLSKASAAEIDAIRAEYWKTAEACVGPLTGRTFVDKLPVHTAKLPLIARLFPQARVVFSVRDPRDVVFSNFRRHVRVRVDYIEWQNLEGIARIYDSMMRIASWSMKNQPLAIKIFHHEDLIDNFDREVQRLADFCGLELHPDMKNFAQLHRPSTMSASAAQVRRGLNAEGIGRWRAYENHMAGVMPLLARWVDEFGYGQS